MKRFTAGFAVAISLVLLVGGVMFYTLQQQADEQVWVDHTYKVLNKTGNIQEYLVDMETGARGFRATYDNVFLEPYFQSQPKLAGDLEELKAMVTDNPKQVDQVAKFTSDALKMDSFWKQVTVIAAYHDEDQKKTVTLAEKTMMDRIRVDVKNIKKEENTLLNERQVKSNAGIGHALWALCIGIFLILVVVFNLIRQVVTAFRSRLLAEDALKDKLKEVEEINTEIQKSNWLLTGIREINGSLIGSDSLKSIIESCLVSITDYMAVPAGAFYFYDRENKELLLSGSVALPHDAQQIIKINEGITGHAATLKQVSVISELPASYWKITSAAGASRPESVICLPLWQKNELRGVIELACFKKETAQYLVLLDAVADNIAIAVNGAYSNEQMARLLQTVQDQKEELESQQEELRQTNEELVHQADTLRASEEELRTQEEELRQVNVEMEEKTEAVEKARQELSKKAAELEVSSKYKSEFLANMSHELRTPLNSVLILAGLLKENKTNNLTDKQIEYSRIIHRSGSDLLELINDILDLSKIEAGKVEVYFENVAVKDISHDMEQLFSAQAQQKKIDFSVSIDAQVPEYISTDKPRLQQVIKNLLSNAFKFTPEHGKVSLHTFIRKDNLEISVTDTGIGISEEKQQLIFEAFQQADGSTNRKFGGTGLGLSISKELVKRLHGKIELRSKDGAGSTFTLVFPLAQSHNSVKKEDGIKDAPVTYSLDHVKEQNIIQDDKAVIKTGDKPILIIEDDAFFASHVNDVARSKGYKTIIAVSGDEGIFYAKKYKPAAIILDLGLPVIDGRNILKILKSDEELKSIPVHLMTAEDTIDIPIDDVESYLQKPMKDGELDQTFANIGNYIADKYKNILILSGVNSNLRSMFERLTTSNNNGVVYMLEDSPKQALEAIKTRSFDCIIADIGSDIQKGIATLQQLKDSDRNDAYIITCLDGDVSSADEKQLKKYSESIIRKSTHASGRLMDEVELFLHKIKNTKNIIVPAQYEQDFDKTLKGKKVLLADDDMRNVFALTALLEGQEMDVVTAENGKEALELLGQNPDVDIVLMDIMMPEMDGYETMRHIRKEKRFEKLPIIALTAKAMTGDREKCLEAGASDYITKPLDSSKLFSLMRVWMAQ